MYIYARERTCLEGQRFDWDQSLNSLYLPYIAHTLYFTVLLYSTLREPPTISIDVWKIELLVFRLL